MEMLKCFHLTKAKCSGGSRIVVALQQRKRISDVQKQQNYKKACDIEEEGKNLKKIATCPYVRRERISCENRFYVLW